MGENNTGRILSDLEQYAAMNKVLQDLADERKKESLRSFVALMVACAVFATSVSVVLYDAYKTKEILVNELAETRTSFEASLIEERNAWIEYVKSLETTTTETTTTETTQTVEGDGANIVNGNQYNDESVHNDKDEKVGDE